MSGHDEALLVAAIAFAVLAMVANTRVDGDDEGGWGCLTMVFVMLAMMSGCALLK